MPYIKQEFRPEYDGLIDELIRRLRRDSDVAVNGDINYCISRIVAAAIKPKNGWNYSAGSEAVKVYECAKLEFVRRILNNVEDSAINRNGDIQEYSQKIF